MNNPRTDRPQLLGKTAFPRALSATRPASLPPTNSGQETAPATAVNGEELFRACLPVIDDVTAQICRRHRLSSTDANDFRSDARTHFIDRDYEVLRKFEGRSSLATYVTTVVQRLFFDFRNRQWGRWRPSAEARRLGPTAVLFEQLVVRDGWTIDQASEILRVNHGVPLDDTLSAFCDDLAGRPRGRQSVPEVDADECESHEPAPDASLVQAGQDFLAKRVLRALARARRSLEAQDQLILKMRFEDSISVADIARALHLDQKRLYRTIERLLACIGKCLDAEGISRSDVRTLFAEGVLNWGQSAEADQDNDNANPEGPHPAAVTRGPWLQKR